MKVQVSYADEYREGTWTMKKMRLKWVVFPRFQLALVLMNAAIMICAFGFSGIQVFRSFENLKKMGAGVGLAPSHPYFGFLTLQCHTVISYLAVAFIISLVLCTVVTLYVSNRLAGPIVRLRSHFREIAEGRPVQPLHFRKGDFFADLPPIVNEALRSLENNKTNAA